MLCIIMRVWTECALKPVPLEVAQGHRKTEISAVSHWGCPHQRASQLVYLHSHLQSLMKGSPQGGIFPEASGFIKVKNSLRLSIKTFVLFIVHACLEFLFQIKQELDLHLQFVGLYSTDWETKALFQGKQDPCIGGGVQFYMLFCSMKTAMICNWESLLLVIHLLPVLFSKLTAVLAMK